MSIGTKALFSEIILTADPHYYQDSGDDVREKSKVGW